MSKFYEARDEDGKTQWIVAHEQTGEHRIFGWLSETRMWHRNVYLEDEFYALTPDMTFFPITPAAVGTRVAAWPKLNYQRVGWLLDELTSLSESEVLSSEQLGLDA